jgi:hypothetical protein
MARKRTKRASEMFPLVAEFKRSGMTQQAFSKKKQIAYGMFLYWLKKYNEAQKPKPPQKSAHFTEVKVASAEPERMIIVKYGSGTEVHIPV